MSNLRNWLVVVALVCAWGMPAQQPFFKNYQVKEGMPSNYTYFVFQDSRGYIWVCTDVGVSRFDGHHFTHYSTAQGLSDNEVFSMLEDQQGRLWFATMNGKPCYFQNEKIYSAQNQPFLRQCDLGGLVHRMLECENGDIVYASRDRVIRFDSGFTKVNSWNVARGIGDMWTGTNGDIGLSSTDSIILVHPKRGRRAFPAKSLVAPLRNMRFGDTLITASYEKIMQTDLRLMQSLDTFVPFGNRAEIVYMKYHKGLLWVGTRSGIFACEYPGFHIVKQYLANHTVTSFLEDREGGMWFSTLEQGLYYIPEPDIVQYTRADGLFYERITCLARDAKNQLWIGSEASSFSVFDGKIIHSRQILKESTRNKAILNIRHFPDGSTLVIGKAGTLMLHNGKEDFLYQCSSDLQIDAFGNFWAGLIGLFYIPKADIPYRIFSPEWLSTPRGKSLYSIRNPLPLNNLRVERIEIDQNGLLWLATATGLYTYEPGSGKQELVLPHITRDLIYDRNTQYIWALTETQGLYALHEGKVVDSIAITNHQGGVICRDICQDEQGNFWIGSAGGLFRVGGKPGALYLNNYWGIFGLGTEKINAVEVMNGYIYLGKDNGFLQVPQSVLTQQSVAPTVHLTNVRVRNVPVQTEQNSALELDYGEQPLSIEFEGLSYKESQNIRYKYRLSGLDENWYTTSNKAVEYAALRPGKYHFEAYAVNSADVSSQIPVQLDIVVLTPIWLKPWFWILFITGIVLATILYIRRREKILQQKFQVERQLMETSRMNTELQKKNTDLRMLALRLQMNPHFIFNALNTIKGYYSQDKIREANSFISKFARLLRLNLDYTDTMIPLDQEINLLKIYIHLSQIRYPDKIDFQLDLNPEINPLEVHIPSMMLQPFVENAVIHGIVPKKGGGTIFIAIEPCGDLLRISIKDNGVGREKNKPHRLHDPHKPLATEITKERLRLLLSRQEIVPLQIIDRYHPNGKAAGTEVVLYIPFQRRDQTTPAHD